MKKFTIENVGLFYFYARKQLLHAFSAS